MCRMWVNNGLYTVSCGMAVFCHNFLWCNHVTIHFLHSAMCAECRSTMHHTLYHIAWLFYLTTLFATTMCLIHFLHFAQMVEYGSTMYHQYAQHSWFDFHDLIALSTIIARNSLTPELYQIHPIAIASLAPVFASAWADVIIPVSQEASPSCLPLCLSA